MNTAGQPIQRPLESHKIRLDNLPVVGSSSRLHRGVLHVQLGAKGNYHADQKWWKTKKGCEQTCEHPGCLLLSCSAQLTLGIRSKGNEDHN